MGIVLAQASGVLVYTDGARIGDIISTAPSQLLPASHIVLQNLA